MFPYVYRTPFTHLALVNVYYEDKNLFKGEGNVELQVNSDCSVSIHYTNPNSLVHDLKVFSKVVGNRVLALPNWHIFHTRRVGEWFERLIEHIEQYEGDLPGEGANLPSPITG